MKFACRAQPNELGFGALVTAYYRFVFSPIVVRFFFLRFLFGTATIVKRPRTTAVFFSCQFFLLKTTRRRATDDDDDHYGLGSSRRTLTGAVIAIFIERNWRSRAVDAAGKLAHKYEEQTQHRRGAQHELTLHGRRRRRRRRRRSAGGAALIGFAATTWLSIGRSWLRTSDVHGTSTAR